MTTAVPIHLDTSPNTHVLFLDMEEIARREGVIQSLVEAKKHPLNPVLPLGAMNEWDSMRASPWAARTVLYDNEDRLFKAWYTGQAGDSPGGAPMGYAVSDDGIHWEKPSLGLHEYRGSKENSICLRALGCVIKDVAEPDERKRFKALIKGEGAPRMAYSPDGIHWDISTKLPMDTMLDAQSLGYKGKFQSPCAFLRDDQTTDPARRYQIHWMTVHKTDKPQFADKEWVRTKSMAFSPDEINWTGSAANPILTPNGSTEYENHLLGIYPYRGYYLMFYEYGWYTMDRASSLPYGNYCADIRLAVSRDGEHYTRILTDQKVISRGRYGEWDDGFLIVADKPAIKDGVAYLYYAGSDHNYPGFAGDQINPPPAGFDKMEAVSKRTSQMGLATLELDRFTCLKTVDGEVPGFAETQPIDVVDPASARLILNVGDTIPRRSWVDVEVLDAGTMAPIAGYTVRDCRPIDRDGLRLPVKWNGDDTLGGVTTSRIVLRFHIYGNAKLYSFGFERA